MNRKFLFSLLLFFMANFTLQAFDGVSLPIGLKQAADCLPSMQIASGSNFDDILGIGKAIEDETCLDVPPALRDDGSEENSGIGNVILSCFQGVIKGFLQSLYDSLKSFWDLIKVSKKLVSFVGEKAMSLAKALWKGGVTAVANEFLSSQGKGFFKKMTDAFFQLYERIGSYFKKKYAEVYVCYSPVAKGELVCRAVSYLGAEFVTGFLFKAATRIGRVAQFADAIEDSSSFLGKWELF